MARLRDVLRAGALAVGRAAAAVSGSYWDAYRAIRDAGLGLTQSQLYRAATAALASARQYAGFTAPDNPRLIPLRIAQPVLTPESITPYRYLVNASWPDPRTGQQRTLRLGINSLERLTAEELRERAIQRVRLEPEELTFGLAPEDENVMPSTVQDEEIRVDLLYFLTRPELG